MTNRLRTGAEWMGTNTSLMLHQDINLTSASVPEHQWFDHATSRDSATIINSEDFKTAIRVLECVIIPVPALFGLFANIINMVVFYRQGLRDKMNLCLFALALVDFVYVFCMFLTTLHCFAAFLTDTLSVQIFKNTVVKFSLSFRFAFLYCSGLLTAIISTERCICVVWPLKSATICTTKTMACLIVGSIVVLNSLCLLFNVRHKVRLVTDETGHVTGVLGDTYLYLNNKFAFRIITDVILFAVSFTTLLLISFVTVVTVRKLKTAMDWRQKTSSNVMDKRQMSLVKILITVSCVYVACNTPNLSLAIARFLVAEFSPAGSYKNLFFVTHRGAFTLLIVNSSVNIFIYYRQSGRFKKELHLCVCCCKDLSLKKN